MGKKEKLELELEKREYRNIDIENIDDDDINVYNTKETVEDDKEYFLDTVCIIKESFQNFVENEAVSLCEYLNFSDLEEFVSYIVK